MIVTLYMYAQYV